MCFSYDYNTRRKLYTGFINELKEDEKENSCVYVMNNYDRIPTILAIELFAYRLYQADRTCDVNMNAQKTPVIISVDERQRLLMQNLFNQYNGNQPFIFGDNNQLNFDSLKVLKTDAPYVIDKITEYKKAIWNECLTYLGINNIYENKKERLITDEANQNNELINLNLQASFAPRLKAVKQMNELFGTNVSLKLRSDLNNILKSTETILVENKNLEIEEGE